VEIPLRGDAWLHPPSLHGPLRARIEASKEDSELIVLSGKNGKFSVQNGKFSGHAKWVQDVWGLVKLKHWKLGESTIKESGIHWTRIDHTKTCL
jgi:hypothetical protein